VRVGPDEGKAGNSQRIPLRLHVRTGAGARKAAWVCPVTNTSNEEEETRILWFEEGKLDLYLASQTPCWVGLSLAQECSVLTGLLGSRFGMAGGRLAGTGRSGRQSSLVQWWKLDTVDSEDY